MANQIYSAFTSLDGYVADETCVGVVALITQLGEPYSGALEILGLAGFFIVLFVGSAWLFRQAALRANRAEHGLIRT